MVPSLRASGAVQMQFIVQLAKTFKETGVCPEQVRGRAFLQKGSSILYIYNELFGVCTEKVNVFLPNTVPIEGHCSLKFALGHPEDKTLFSKALQLGRKMSSLIIP